MTPLKWRYVSKNVRHADGHYTSWWYELVRENTDAGTWWTAWFHDYPHGKQRIGYGNFIQARAACIKHHNHKGY